MGFLFQHAALFDSISLGENVAFGLRRGDDLKEGEIRERAERRLEQVGLGGEYHKMPAALSGGMRKRAGLARALAMDPEVLLVDEPSAGLDPITSAEIDDLLLDLKTDGNTTMVIVTHNMPSVRRIGDRFALLEDGRIRAEGAVSELDGSEDPTVRRFVSADTGG
jgi:phospholipid/cholesterol/gamma-HCH transport system ATP-binding protein